MIDLPSIRQIQRNRRLDICAHLDISKIPHRRINTACQKAPRIQHPIPLNESFRIRAAIFDWQDQRDSLEAEHDRAEEERQRRDRGERRQTIARWVVVEEVRAGDEEGRKVGHVRRHGKGSESFEGADLRHQGDLQASWLL